MQERDAEHRANVAAPTHDQQEADDAERTQAPHTIRQGLRCLCFCASAAAAGVADKPFGCSSLLVAAPIFDQARPWRRATGFLCGTDLVATRIVAAREFCFVLLPDAIRGVGLR